jgi:nicotinamidase-related amidase
MALTERRNWRHICVDMQRLFADETPWHVEWAEKILPRIVEVVSAAPERTLFTRFITPMRPEDMPGLWQDYYRKWWMVTREHMDPALLDLVPDLQRFTPPATVFDKPAYSPWLDGRLHRMLQGDGVDTLVISGGETDVCVLATVLTGIDLGYRVIVLTDAVCSSADKTYDASLYVLGSRFSVQADMMSVDEFLGSVA